MSGFMEFEFLGNFVQTSGFFVGLDLVFIEISVADDRIRLQIKINLLVLISI